MLHYFGFAEKVIQPWIEQTWKDIESEMIDYDLHLWHWIAFSETTLHLWSWENDSVMQHFSLVDSRIKDWKIILLNPNQINQFLVQLSNGTIQCFLYIQNDSSLSISLQFSTSQICCNTQFGYDLLQSNIFYAIDVSQKKILQFTITSNSYTCTTQFETTSPFEIITHLFIGFHNWICKLVHQKWQITKCFGWGNNFFHCIPVQMEDQFLSTPQPLLFEQFDIELDSACISNCWGTYLTTTGQLYWSTNNNTVCKANTTEEENACIYLLEKVINTNQSIIDMSDVIVEQIIGNARHVLAKTTQGTLIAMGNTSLLTTNASPFTIVLPQSTVHQLCKTTHWGSVVSLK